MKETVINKKITYSIVAVLLIVLITIGATYAYFSAQAQTDVQTVTTGTLTMGFTNGEIINATGITPINDSEIETKATVLPFSVTNTGNQHMKLTIKLTDITIDDALKDVDFRWGLYNPDKQDAAETEMGVSFGIFKYSQTGGEEILLQDVVLDKNSATKNYKLRIWIHDDGALQNEMQGKTFSGKVVVTGEAVEYTPESCFTIDASGKLTSYDAVLDENGNPTHHPETGYPIKKNTCPKDVVIPKTIKGIPVTNIGKNIFDFSDIHSLIIPDSVTTIDDAMLSFQTGLENIHLTIPESVITIKGKLMSYSSLYNITIPESVTSNLMTQDSNGFYIENFKAKTVIIPGSIKKVQGMALSLMNSTIENVILMEGIEQIEPHFNLKQEIIEIPRSVKKISPLTFLTENGLKQIVIRGKSSISEFENSSEFERPIFTDVMAGKDITTVFRP